MECETSTRELTIVPPSQFLHLPSLGSLDFTNLVHDVKHNSRLPSVGQDLEIKWHQKVHPNLDIEVKRQLDVDLLPHFRTKIRTSVSLDNTSSPDRKHQANTVTRGTLSISPSSLSAPLILQKDGTLIKNGNFDEMERILVKDLLLVFQGCNGSILQWGHNNCFGFYTAENLLHPSHKTLALRLCPIGVCYKMIKSQLYVPVRGKCFEALKCFFQAQLREFDLMVLRLEQLIKGQASKPDMKKYSKIVPYGSDTISLHQLECLMYDSKKLLKAMTSILSHIKPDSEGGRLCSILCEFTQHGDPEIQDFAYRTLANVARPIYKMIGNWIFHGSFQDKFDEFFITVNPSCLPENMWREKFSIKTEMIPSFLSPKDADLIFRAGKNLNFLSEVCKAVDTFQDKSRLFHLYKDIDIEHTLQEKDLLFRDLIKTTFMVTSDLVMKEVLTYERLFEHLHAIKYYILHEQGDFFELFVHKIRNDLVKPARVMNTIDLQATLLFSILEATHTPTREYLERVYVTRSPFGEDDQVWDVLCLEYKTSPCLRQVLTADTMTLYSRVFSFLWDTRRSETLITSMWMEKKMFNIKLLRVIPEIGIINLKNNNLLHEFNNVIRHLRFYAMFEAVETQWQKLIGTDLLNVTCLEDIINSHENFIKILNTRCLQTPSSFQIVTALQAIYGHIHKFEKYHTAFCNRISREYTRRCSAKGEEVNTDFQEFLKKSEILVDHLQKISRDSIQMFLLAVENYMDDTDTNIYLSGLGYRIDFNDFYSQKNPKLEETRTFQHQRLSQSQINLTSSFCSTISM